jgi:peroxiredoxin
MRVRRLSLAYAALLLAGALIAAAPAGAAPAAPPITVSLLGSGEKFDSRSLIGKKVLLIRFQASWCKVCAAEADGVERVYEAYKDRGVEFLGVHIQDTEVDARRFLTEHHATYPAGLDPRLRIGNRFGFRGTPYTVVIDRKGEIVARIHGSADEARLRRTLDPLVQPRPAKKAPPKRLQ